MTMDNVTERLSHAELKRLRKPVKNVNREHQERLSRLERFAVAITDRIGSMGFFFIILVWTAAWLGWNTLAPMSVRFDPFPAFVLWLFISNMLQIFLMPLIMIGQNLQGRHAENRRTVGKKLSHWVLLDGCGISSPSP